MKKTIIITSVLASLTLYTTTTAYAIDNNNNCKSKVTKKLLNWSRNGDYREQLGKKAPGMSDMEWILKERNIVTKQRNIYMEECLAKNVE